MAVTVRGARPGQAQVEPAPARRLRPALVLVGAGMALVAAVLAGIWIGAYPAAAGCRRRDPAGPRGGRPDRRGGRGRAGPDRRRRAARTPAAAGAAGGPGGGRSGLLRRRLPGRLPQPPGRSLPPRRGRRRRSGCHARHRLRAVADARAGRRRPAGRLRRRAVRRRRRPSPRHGRRRIAERDPAAGRHRRGVVPRRGADPRAAAEHRRPARGLRLAARPTRPGPVVRRRPGAPLPGHRPGGAAVLRPGAGRARRRRRRGPVARA